MGMDNENRPQPEGISFSQDAARVFSLAQEEAEQMRHPYIGTGHVLLGLLRLHLPEITAAIVPNGQNPRIFERRLQQEIATSMGRSKKVVMPVLNPEAKKVIEYSVDEARLRHRKHIGPAFLLFGFSRTAEESVVGEILQKLGVRLEDLRSGAVRALEAEEKRA